MTTAVVVGNPRRRSRTYDAAVTVVTGLTGAPPDLALDLADFGPRVLEADDPEVGNAVRAVTGHDLVVFASPTYKASYTGLLKVFLDRFPPDALAGVTAVPLMLGGHWRHGLAAELLLKPVLVELGATAPTRGLFLLDSELTGETLDAWLPVARGQVTATTASR